MALVLVLSGATISSRVEQCSLKDYIKDSASLKLVLGSQQNCTDNTANCLVAIWVMEERCFLLAEKVSEITENASATTDQRVLTEDRVDGRKWPLLWLNNNG